jgi:predicted outer membrane repeat protein
LEGRTLMSGLSLTAATVPALIADINAANTAGGANTITLTAKTTSPYLLTAVNNSTNAANGLPVIAANDNLTIVGNGDTIERNTTSAITIFRLFAVAGGGSLTLENLALQGGGGNDGINAIWEEGGAIYNSGTLVLNDVTVQDNSAFVGGGIYSNYGSVTTLEGGTIVQNNLAFGSGGTADGGGGLYVSGGVVNVTNATLDENNAETGGGGALYVYGGNVSLSNDTLKSNSAALGGGLFVNASMGPATVTLAYDTVESNTATGKYGEGGGLYVYSGGATVTLSYDTVESNTATNSSGYKLNSGGGLYVSGGNVTLANDTLESNIASEYGGGLYVNSGTVTLSNDTVESNTASLYGGGIYCTNSSATVYLDSSTVANTINNTDESGLDGSTANIDGTYLLQNP